MSKLFSVEPIFIQTVQMLKNIEANFSGKQCIRFFCTQCNTVYSRRLVRIREMHYVLLCRSCIRKNLFKDPIYKKKYTESVLQTSLRRYGTLHPKQSPIVQEKYKQTCLKKYGVENVSQLPTVKEKIVKNNFKKYGVAYPSQTKKVKEKIKQTCLKKYGVTSTGQITSVKEKGKQTSLQHYGVVNPNQCKEIKEKKKQTCLKKYGVENISQAQEIKEKKKQTFLKHFGVDHVWKFINMKKFIKEKARQTWAQKSPEELRQIRVKSVKKYVYKNQSFDSSWELAVWIWATETGKSIVREPIFLEYEFEGKTHAYYPDFDIDGQLVEVKGDHFFNKKGEMQNPYDHTLDKLFEAKHQCGLKHNVQFWTEKEMKLILDYIISTHGPDWLKLFNNNKQ